MTSLFPEAPRVWNLYKRDAPPGARYIGRPGRGILAEEAPHGNPVALGRCCPVCDVVHTRTDLTAALACYEKHLLRRLETDAAYALLFDALEGCDLVCFCAPAGGLTASARLRCHGQVILHVLAQRRAARILAAGGRDAQA